MTDDFLSTMRKRMQEARDAELPHAERAKDDLLFVTGEAQWREEDRIQREAEGKPCLTFNAFPQYIRQVTGQVRSLNPAIKVSPADGAASKDVAEVIEGLIRQIEYKSDAQSVYEGATESAAQCSIGHWRIRADYCDEYSFDQEILIERIYNPFAVFYDPQAKHPTRMDAQYCFIIAEMPKDEFKDAYPDATASDFTSDHKIAEYREWGSQDTVVIAEYYWIEHDEVEIALLPSGQVIRGPFPKDVALTKKRKTQVPRVKWAKVTGKEILEGPNDIPGRYIPVVAVTGEEIHLGVSTYRSSVGRFAKDAQMLYNVSRSSEAEVVMLQPRAPYLVTTSQIAGEGIQELWAKAGSANLPYLPYNLDEKAPPPMRLPPPMPSAGFAQMSQVAIDDMKRTTGIYDASLGQRSNETSGKAIQERKMESQNSTSVYQDNMVKAINQTGKIIIDMLPSVYDAKRAIRILGEDDQERMVVINDILPSLDGIQPVNDMTLGRYDVRVSVGPAFTTRRQEAAAAMSEFMRAVPNVAPFIADLVAKSSDWPDSDRIAERLRKAAPPGVVEDDDEEKTPEQQQMQMQQMQAAQQQQAMQQQAQEVEMRKAVAEAAEAEADAAKAAAEAQKAQIEVAQITGQLDAMINQRVSQALGALMPPPAYQPM